jgi:hypothetical protein
MKEFDEEAASSAAEKLLQSHWDFIAGARWQYEKLKAELEEQEQTSLDLSVQLSNALYSMEVYKAKVEEAELELRQLKGTASGAY